jgi:HD superfamily phosphohydrolases
MMTSILINDPIHGVIALPKKIIHGLIDHPYFQRLRHIKQLGMVDLIFPTAVHTRFSHSIGTAYVAYKMANHLNLSPNHAHYALVSALLHDIGHGPFSHAFEELLEKNTESDQGVVTKIPHERWTLHFLKGYETSLGEQGLDYKIVNQLIQGSYFDSAESQTSANKNTVADIISSQLDADRLDYLLRDSHFCGVSYGKADIEWIITHLSVVTHPNHSSRLAVKETAWRAVEHFFIVSPHDVAKYLYASQKKCIRKIVGGIFKSHCPIFTNKFRGNHTKLRFKTIFNSRGCLSYESCGAKNTR